MLASPTFLLALLALGPTSAFAGLFSSHGDVQLLSTKGLRSHLKATDKGTMVAFYAPWCGVSLISVTSCVWQSLASNSLLSKRYSRSSHARISSDEPILSQYCKQLRPQYEKAATNLRNLVHMGEPIYLSFTLLPADTEARSMQWRLIAMPMRTSPHVRPSTASKVRIAPFDLHSLLTSVQQASRP